MDEYAELCFENLGTILPDKTTSEIDFVKKWADIVVGRFPDLN